MEQIVILIIIYVLYALFSSIVKKAKGQQKPPVKRPGTGMPQTGRPAVPQQRPSQPAGEAAPELELPPFLREMLGLEKPKPAPTPPPEPFEEKKESQKLQEPEIPNVSERIPLSARMYADEIEDLSRPFPTEREKSTGKIRQLLSNRESIREAFILKEILDRPVSKRGRRFPFAGMM
jgi:hypothetical protein